ncbi:hypothetical protein HZH66_009396 [Vespula vulgaris]|uniref:Uncharacterized protein n=1 Tax=Vespula vulgaris TaxID=7454 RepID=A0A834JSX2_VESVU|nr:hypothetical protein HZH66_009396 [Vespula vulgaris]
MMVPEVVEARMLASALPPLIVSCYLVSGLCGQAGNIAKEMLIHLWRSIFGSQQNMYMTALWIAFILAQSSRLLVEGIRSHYVDSTQIAEINEMGDNPADNREPTCKELRTMWRYTKRQSRAIQVMNKLPFVQDFFAYNAWKNYQAPPQPPLDYRDYTDRPRTRAAGSAPPVYGRIVHKAPPGSRLRSSQQMPHRTKAFEDVAYLYGTINFHPPSSRRRQSSFRIGGGASPPISQVPQAGSFQHLRDLIRGERARELRKQHESDRIAAAKAATIKDYSNVDQDDYQNVPRLRKHFANSLDGYQQFRNPKGDISRAWSKYEKYNICKNNTLSDAILLVRKRKLLKRLQSKKLDDMYSLQRGDHYLPEYMLR